VRETKKLKLSSPVAELSAANPGHLCTIGHIIFLLLVIDGSDHGDAETTAECGYMDDGKVSC
jgi:hypothetical protein